MAAATPLGAVPVPSTPIVETVEEEDVGKQLIAEAELDSTKKDTVWNLYNAAIIPNNFNVDDHDMRNHLYMLQPEPNVRNDLNLDYESLELSGTLDGVKVYDDLYSTSVFEACYARLEQRREQKMHIEEVKGSKCIKCGKSAVTAVLKQLRSADEGATEVRTCMKCGSRQ